MTNNTASLHAAFLVVIALFAFAVAPPLGVILLIAAYFVQRHFRRRGRGDVRARRVAAQERADRERILAAKSLP